MLTSKQRAKLRALSQVLQPIIYIGKAGITENIITQAEEAILPNELIKGTVQQSSPISAKDAMNEIAEKTGAEAVFTSGRKFVLYKKNPKESKIEI
jgi:RNA-binding protein